MVRSIRVAELRGLEEVITLKGDTYQASEEVKSSSQSVGRLKTSKTNDSPRPSKS